MMNNIVDLFQIPIYKDMIKILYVDRGMVKWAGMLLSEHSEQLKEQESNNNGIS